MTTTPPVPPQHQAAFARMTHGPAPYSRGPDENVRCPNCQKYNEPDAVYCDQCGSKLPDGPSKPYVRGPGEDVQCQLCGKYNAGDARYCDQCGTKLSAAAFDMVNPETSGGNGQQPPSNQQPPPAA